MTSIVGRVLARFLGYPQGVCARCGTAPAVQGRAMCVVCAVDRPLR